jgi:hypothetical protein
LYFVQVVLEHVIKGILRRLDEVAELLTHLALTGRVPNIMAVLNEDTGVLHDRYRQFTMSCGGQIYLLRDTRSR